jgi:hypothetical protein
VLCCALTLWLRTWWTGRQNEAGAKLFDLPLGFYGALSDDISTGVQIRSYLYEAMAGISPEDPSRKQAVSENRSRAEDIRYPEDLRTSLGCRSQVGVRVVFGL